MPTMTVKVQSKGGTSFITCSCGAKKELGLWVMAHLHDCDMEGQCQCGKKLKIKRKK